MAAKSTVMEMVISTQYDVCGAWARVRSTTRAGTLEAGTFRRRRERSPRPEVLRETGRCAAKTARRGRHAVLQAITCSKEAADALPSLRW
jgi:hypothetical protein